MDAGQIMRFVSTDGSGSWTEVCASNEQPHTQNPVVLSVFDPSMVSMGRQIAEGGQGSIYEAKLYEPFSFRPLPVVVKKFKPSAGVSQGHYPLEIFSVKCYSVCQILGAFSKEDSLCIIMRRYSCDLRAHIDAHMKDLRDETSDYDGPPFLEFTAMHIILHLAMSMKGLHECGIYHRDLKAANILVRRLRNNDGELQPTVALGITDFERSDCIVGTAFYRAPEVLLSLIARVRLSQDQWMLADIYSFGMVCYEVLTGRIPFDGHRPRVYDCRRPRDHDLVVKGGRPELPDHVPERMKDVITRCWHADPSFRPSWTDIIEVLTQPSENDYHTVLKDINTDNLASLESSVGSSIESNVVKLKQLIHAHMELHSSESEGFANYLYWTLEFVATAEEYVSKFDVKFPSENPLLCKWPEFVELRKLGALLTHQITACNFTIALSTSSISQDELVLEDDSLLDFELQREEIAFSMKEVYFPIALQARQVQYAGEFDEDISWIGKLLFFHAINKWQLWNEVVIQVMVPPIVNPEDGVEEFIFFVCCIIVALVDTYIYVLALFTYEPIMLCLQYGLYRIKGCNNILYRSSGYRICRLQRAWMNYTRSKRLSIALVLSFLYLVATYKWKGVFGWLVLPCLLRSRYWRRAIFSQ